MAGRKQAGVDSASGTGSTCGSSFGGINIDLYWCDACNKGFAWRSRYERHLASGKHKQEAVLSDMIAMDFEQSTSQSLEVNLG